jgi:hypothetical protein
MKKQIKVKGAIKVDKGDLDNIRAGTCAHMGKECETDIIIIRPTAMMESEMVDRLYI